MTLIVTFQGKKCALLASDLLLRFIPQDQLSLPPADRHPIALLAEKFRPVASGDYMAWNGQLNQVEMSALNGKTLEELTSSRLTEDLRFRADSSLTLFYASLAQAQVYAGDLSTPLFPLNRGQPMASCDQMESSQALMEITESMLRRSRKYNVEFLRDLSTEYQRYVLGHENSTNAFGGYVSYILKPGKIRLHSKVLGKLQGLPEAHVREDGLVSF